MSCDELERKRTGSALTSAVRIFFAKLAQGANIAGFIDGVSGWNRTTIHSLEGCCTIRCATETRSETRNTKWNVAERRVSVCLPYRNAMKHTSSTQTQSYEKAHVLVNEPLATLGSVAPVHRAPPLFHARPVHVSMPDSRKTLFPPQQAPRSPRST